MIATAGADSHVVIWDPLNASRISVLKEHSDEVQDVTFSPDGMRLASASLDGSIIVWDVRTENIQMSLTQEAGPNASVKFSPDGQHLVTSGGNGVVHIWDAHSGEERMKLSLEWKILGLSISPDGVLLAIELENGTVHVHAMAADEDELLVEEIAVLEGMPGTLAIRIPTHNFSPDGAYIIGVGQDSSIIIWDAKTGKVEKVIYCHPLAITMSISPDGTRAAVSGEDGSTRICRIDSAFEWITTASPQIASVVYNNAAFSADSRRLYTTSYDRSLGEGTIKGWDMTSPGVKTNDDELLNSEGLDLTGLGGAVYDVALSPDDNHLAASGLGTARVWDIHSGELLMSFDVHNPTAAVWGIDISPDGKRLATASSNEDSFNPEGTAAVWDISTGEQLLSLQGHGNWITDINFSPDGSKLVTASTDGIAIIWDAQSGTRLMNFNHDTEEWSPLWSAIFSPDGRYLAISGGEGLFQIWDLNKGRDSSEMRNHCNWSVMAV